ncbi:MAG: YveK family protein [Candidatus Fimenecus sp.]
MKQNDNATIDLMDLWRLFCKKWWVMLLAAVAVSTVMWGVVRLTFVPEYTSTATLYILKEHNEQKPDSSVASDFSLALNVVNDCTYIAKSHAVLDQVIDELQLNISYSNLYNCVTISNPQDTRILEVRVTADSPQNAKQIADCLCEIAVVQIEKAMGFQQVNFYEYAILNTSPSNTVSMKTYLQAAMAAAALVYAIYVLRFFLDGRMRTEEDIQKYLGLTVLGDIPDVRKVNGKHSRYYSYGYGRRKIKTQEEEN